MFGFAHPVAYNFPTLRAAVESAMTLLALIGAWLVRAQFVQGRRLRELLLMGALLALALVEFVANTLPAALHLDPGGGLTAAGPCGALAVAAAFVAAALTPPNVLIAGGRRPIIVTVSLTVAAVAVAELAGVLLYGQLQTTVVHSGAGTSDVVVRPLGVALALGTAGLFAFAGSEFARRARLDGRRALGLFAGAAAVLAGAGLYSLVWSSASPGSIAIPEGLRFVAVVLVLAAVLRQDLENGVTARRAAAIAERRRVAEDLHDGLAQELAFIAAYGSRITDEHGREHPVAIAARRALAISRNTINELSDLGSAPLSEALEASAHELRNRFEIAIAVDVHPHVEFAPSARDRVTRIVREAIANAARHGHAHKVAVSVSYVDDGIALRVCDDGRGIDGAPDSQAPAGFGLRSMREHAQALGGDLEVQHRDSGGTELTIFLPRCVA